MFLQVPHHMGSSPYACPRPFQAIPAELDLQAIKYKRQRCLGNLTPCQVFTANREFACTYTRRKQKAVHDWIKENARIDRNRELCG